MRSRKIRSRRMSQRASRSERARRPPRRPRARRPHAPRPPTASAAAPTDATPPAATIQFDAPPPAHLRAWRCQLRFQHFSFNGSFQTRRRPRLPHSSRVDTQTRLWAFLLYFGSTNPASATMGLSEPPTPGSRGAACMQCNQTIVIAITQSRWQSCSSATFVKVGVLQPIQYYFNVIIYLSIYELGAWHSYR